MLLLGISFEDIADAALNFFIMIGIHINAMIYNVATFLFDIFVSIISATIFNTEDYEKIANSVYLVIGVVALFIVSYALLRAIIDPDGTGKSNYAIKKIVPNILIAVVLIAFVPFIFDNAFKLQGAVVKSNVIPNVIFGRNLNGVNATDSEIEHSGRMMTNDVFMAFFVPTHHIDGTGQTYSDNLNNYYNSMTITNCWLFFCDGNTLSFGEAKEKVANGEEGFGIYAEYADWMHGKDSDRNKIEYNWLLQLISGVVLVYVLLNFCIDMAVRVVKLGYFQIIAPIPILTIMIPGQKKIFDNWMKQSIQTFLDVFLRIFIIFMGVFLINTLPPIGDDLWTQSLSPTHPNIARAFIMIGILIFMKQAPKLISDIFGISSGSFKLGIADKLGEMALVGNQAKNLVNSTGGAITGALGAGWTSRRNGMGWKEGMKFGFAQGWNTKNPKQFNAMRQSFYKDAMQGEGKAAFFGPGRSYFDKKGAQWVKDAKNAYKKENFNRVLKYQQSEDWMNLYKASYTQTTDKLRTDQAEVETKMNTRSAEFDKIENDLKEKIAYSQINTPILESQKRILEREKQEFELNNQASIASWQAKYDAAVAAKDISAQLDAQKQLEDLKSLSYSNPELEKNIKDLESRVGDLNQLQTQLKQVENQRFNDSQLNQYKAKFDEYANQLEKLKKENDYITTGKYKDNKGNTYDTRSYASEKAFYAENEGFSEVLKNVNALFKEGNGLSEGEDGYVGAHPDFKDVYDTHMKNITKEEVSSFINSAEGQKQIAALQQAQKNLQSGGGSKDDKK